MVYDDTTKGIYPVVGIFDMNICIGFFHVVLWFLTVEKIIFYIHLLDATEIQCLVFNIKKNRILISH